MNSRKSIALLFLLSLILNNSCTTDNSVDPLPDIPRGKIVSSELIHTYEPEAMNQFLALNDIQIPFQLEYPVEAYRIIYQSVDINNSVINVSGALFIPVGVDNLPLISIQHGTQTFREGVASINPVNPLNPEGLLGIVMGSIGYVACVPDYPGLGYSNSLHPFIHAKSLSNSVIDFIRASSTFVNEKAISLNGRNYIAGYSEGGYATLATQKEIELNYSDEIKITASCPMSGPYDLRTSVENILQADSIRFPTYLAYFGTAYDNIYKWNRLNEIFNKPFAGMMPTLFDGSRTYGQINDELPKRIDELFTLSFLSAWNNGGEREFKEALKENTLLNWTPKAPIRFYHGNADEIIDYQNSVTALQIFQNNGAGSIELVTIEGGTHESSIIPALTDMIDWIKTFEEAESNRLNDPLFEILRRKVSLNLNY